MTIDFIHISLYLLGAMAWWLRLSGAARTNGYRLTTLDKVVSITLWPFMVILAMIYVASREA